MAYLNSKKQHAVGQGFFHTSELFCDYNGENFFLRYVYDCGSAGKYSAARDKAINQYLSEIGTGNILDVLFISHTHEDHINGIEKLLGDEKTLKVDTIVMPYIGIEERLIAYVETSINDPGAENTEFYREFVIDPVNALTRFSPRQIIFVESGDGGAPGREGPIDGSPEGGDGISGGKGEEYGAAWKLIGRGTVRMKGVSENTSVVVIPDSTAMRIDLSRIDLTDGWILAPYIDEVVVSASAEFIKSIAAQFGKSIEQMNDWMKNKNNVRSLINVHLDSLTYAYEKTFPKKVNLTSLCLYSGPVTDQNNNYHTFTQVDENLHCHSFDCGWLGTGDAMLKEVVRHTALFTHYGKYLDHTATLTLPHHGADANFHGDLLKVIKPDVCVAAADFMQENWRHPGHRTVQTVASYGSALLVTTSDTRSEVSQQICLLE